MRRIAQRRPKHYFAALRDGRRTHRRTRRRRGRRRRRVLPYRTEQTEVEFYVDVTVTNLQQKKIPTVKKLSVQDNIVCCQNLLLNQNIVKSHIFSAIQIKLRKYKRCHENARGNGSHSNSVIVPFSVDTQGNFCSVALLFLKSMAKLKFKNMPGDKRWPVKRSATPIA